MAKGINIAIGADTRAYADAVKKGMIDPTQEAAEALADLGKDGARDLGKLEGEMRDAQRATEKTTDEVEDLKKRLKDVGDEAKRSVGDKTRKATDDASEGMEELKDEGTGTAKEVAASFDGSMESIAGGFQEVAANAFSGFGPAGAAAGIAAAAGLGLVMAAFTEQQEAADELKERITSAYRTAIEEGQSYLSEAQIIEAALDILQSDRAEKLRENAEKLGVAFNTVLRAEAGDYEALEEVIAAAEKAQSDRFAAGAREAGDRSMQIDTEIGSIEGIIRSLEDQKKVHDDSKAAAEAYSEFVTESEQKQRDQIKRTTATDQARYEAAAVAAGKLAQRSVVIPVKFQEPDANAVRSNLQRKLNNLGPVRVDAEVYTRNGTPVY